MYATDQVSLLYVPEISDRVFSKAISLCFLDALDYSYLTMIFNWSTFDVDCLHMLAVFIKNDKRLLITKKKWISITYSIIKASVLPTPPPPPPNSSSFHLIWLPQVSLSITWIAFYQLLLNCPWNVNA